MDFAHGQARCSLPPRWQPAFLGGQLRDDRALGAGTWLGIGAFVAIAVLSIAILWPWTWIFSTSAAILIEDYIEIERPSEPRELQLSIARSLETHWNRNQVKLGRLFWVFRVASLCLVLEIVVWLIALES